MAIDNASPTTNRSALFIVFLVVFIDLLGFGIVLPLLPRIADAYVSQVVVAGPAKETIIGGVIGALMSMFSLMQFIFAPIWGRISDRVGRRPILLLGLVGSVVFYTVFGWAATFPPETHARTALILFFMARIGAGVAGATIATAQAVIADSTPPEKRKHGMAIIGMAFGMGFTLGPLIGFGALGVGRITEAVPNHALVGYAAAALSLIALFLGLILLPETRRFGTASSMERRGFRLAAWRRALGSSAIGPVILIFFLTSLGFGAFEVTLALLLKDVFAYSERESLLVFAFVGFVLMLTQGFLYRKLAHRWTEIRFMLTGILLMAGGVASLGTVTYVTMAENVNPQSTSHGLAKEDEGSHHTEMWPFLYFSLTLAVVGFAFLTPSAQALVSRRTDADHQGAILGVNQSASALARILGPLFGVPLYKSTPDHLLPYIFGTVLLLLMLPLIPRARRG